MSLEEKLADLTQAMSEFPDIPKMIEVKIADNIDSDRIARALESIANSLSEIARRK